MALSKVKSTVRGGGVTNEIVARGRSGEAEENVAFGDVWGWRLGLNLRNFMRERTNDIGEVFHVSINFEG